MLPFAWGLRLERAAKDDIWTVISVIMLSIASIKGSTRKHVVVVVVVDSVFSLSHEILNRELNFSRSLIP